MIKNLIPCFIFYNFNYSHSRENIFNLLLKVFYIIINQYNTGTIHM